MSTDTPSSDDTDESPTKAAIYARVSTKDQDTSSQVEVCVQHAKDHPDIDEWETYGDVMSGHDDSREDYVRMKEDIANGEYDYFICSEFSRISRNDNEIKNFISDCFEREMGVEVVQSSFSVAPDADAITRQAMKIVADTLANIATMENLQKIDRINRGIKHAREAGKWTRKPPAGFEVDPETSHLQVNVEEFLAIREALLEHYYNGTPWPQLADAAGVSRTTLSRIYNDEERRRLFIHGEGWDKWDRDEIALENADVPEGASLPNDVDILDDADLSHEVAALKDANLKLYLQILNDAPERIDPDAERESTARESTVSDGEEAMLSTMLDLMERAQNGDEELTEDEVMELYEENRDTVGDVMAGDD